MQPAVSTIIDGRYELLSQLGEGGMGTVFKARELSIGRVVAVKFLHPSLLENPENRARFEREAEICSSLNHEHICAFFRFGVWQSQTPYIVMEYVEGKTLREVLNEQTRLPWQRAVRLIASIADAMEYVHSRAIMHRDIKPSNFMLVSNPVEDYVKVMDFGLGRLVQEHTESQKYTQTGALIGTVFYMSPEQCQGKPADYRADIYALGCVLFECLTGEPPFTADNPVGMLHMHAHEPHKKLNSFPDLAQIPRGLEEVVASVLAKSPDDRYQSMSEFKNDLMRVLAGEQPHKIAKIFQPTQKRNWKLPIFAFAIFLAVTLAAVNVVPIVSFLTKSKLLADASAEQVANSLADRSPLSAAQLLVDCASVQANTQPGILQSARLQTKASKLYLRNGRRDDAASLIIAATKKLFSLTGPVSPEEEKIAADVLTTLTEISPNTTITFYESLFAIADRYFETATVREKLLIADVTFASKSNRTSDRVPSLMVELADLKAKKEPNEARVFLSQAMKSAQSWRYTNNDEFKIRVSLVFVALGESEKADELVRQLSDTSKLRFARECILRSYYPQVLRVVQSLHPTNKQDEKVLEGVWIQYYLGVGSYAKASALLTKFIDKLSDKAISRDDIEIAARYLECCMAENKFSGSDKRLLTVLAMFREHQPATSVQVNDVVSAYRALKDYKGAEEASVSMIQNWLKASQDGNLAGIPLLIIDQYLAVLASADRLNSTDTLLPALLNRYEKAVQEGDDKEHCRSFLQVLLRQVPMYDINKWRNVSEASIKQWQTPSDVIPEALSALLIYADMTNKKANYESLCQKAFHLMDQAAIYDIKNKRVTSNEIFRTYLCGNRLGTLRDLLVAEMTKWRTPADVDMFILQSYAVCMTRQFQRRCLSSEECRILDLAGQAFSDGKQTNSLNELVHVNCVFERFAQAENLLAGELNSWKNPESVSAGSMSWYLQMQNRRQRLDWKKIESSNWFKLAMAKQNDASIRDILALNYLTTGHPQRTVDLLLPSLHTWKTPESVPVMDLWVLIAALRRTNSFTAHRADIYKALKLAEKQFERLRTAERYEYSGHLLFSYVELSEPESGIKLCHAEMVRWTEPRDVNFPLLLNYCLCKVASTTFGQSDSQIAPALRLAEKAVDRVDEQTPARVEYLARTYDVCGETDKAVALLLSRTKSLKEDVAPQLGEIVWLQNFLDKTDGWEAHKTEMAKPAALVEKLLRENILDATRRSATVCVAQANRHLKTPEQQREFLESAVARWKTPEDANGMLLGWYAEALPSELLPSRRARLLQLIKLAEKNPNRLAALDAEGLARVYVKLDMLPEAVRVLGTWVEKEPVPDWSDEYPRVISLLKTILEKQNRFSDINRYIDKLSAFQPGARTQLAKYRTGEKLQK